MKKFISIVLAIILTLVAGSTNAFASDNLSINISNETESYEISDNLYGVFIEDISYACDGGLVSNLVNNNSFEYESNKTANWTFENVKSSIEKDDALNKNNTNYALIEASGEGTINNIGYPEYYDYKSYDVNKLKSTSADMGFVKNHKYAFSCYVKNIDFDGTFSVKLDSKNNDGLVSIDISQYKNDWKKVECQLTSLATEDGGLSIIVDGNGQFQLDFVTLVDESSYGYGTNEWKYTSLRSDLYNALDDLNPQFIRFPGGCLCEGTDVNNLYNWKNTIGPLEERQQDTNLWKDDENGRQYINTNSMGYNEYFQLASDLGAEPLPILNVGLTCQGRCSYDEYVEKHDKGEISDKEWEEYLDSIALRPKTDEWNSYVKDIFDLIEYANGDSKTTYWGAIRSANGHEKPYDLKYIGLGNENWGEVYFRNFDALYKAVKEKYPNITVISSSGTWLEGDAYDSAWKKINKDYADTIVDEHYYTGDGYLFDNNERYDDFDRNGAKVFVGEYAATSKGVGTIQTKSNIWEAVEEASYLTGLERNGDVVEMASYAPTFAKINSQCWNINLIWFNSHQSVLTPSYYTQMLFSNNYGNTYLNSTFENGKTYTNDKVYESVTLDKDTKTIYVKLVNASGEKKSVNLNIDGYDVNTASVQYIDANFKSACNEIDKTYVAPQEKELSVNNSSIDVEMGKYSVNVVRISYGNAGAGSIYHLDSKNQLTGTYIPTAIKVAVPATVWGVIVFGVAVFGIVKMVKSKKAKKDKE